MKYTRSQCARRFGISMDALRYYETLGLICPDKDDGGHRLYSQEQVVTMLDIRKLKALGLSNEELLCRTGDEHARHSAIYQSALRRMEDERDELQMRIDYVRGMQETLSVVEKQLDTLFIGSLPERRFFLFAENSEEAVEHLMEGLPFLNYGYWISRDEIGRGHTALKLVVDVLPLRRFRPSLYEWIEQHAVIRSNGAGMKIYRYLKCTSFSEIGSGLNDLLDYARLHNFEPCGDIFGGIIGPGVLVDGVSDGFIVTQTMQIR